MSLLLVLQDRGRICCATYWLRQIASVLGHVMRSTISGAMEISDIVDEIPESHATNRVKTYIRSQFDDIRQRYNASIVVEKTYASPIVSRSLTYGPSDAKYINIVRDGIDATGSAKLNGSQK